MLLLCVSPFTYNISKLFPKKNYEGTTKSKATNQLSTSREGTSQVCFLKFNRYKMKYIQKI